jgi:hypothetical protein
MGHCRYEQILRKVHIDECTYQYSLYLELQLELLLSIIFTTFKHMSLYYIYLAIREEPYFFCELKCSQLTYSEIHPWCTLWQKNTDRVGSIRPSTTDSDMCTSIHVYTDYYTRWLHYYATTVTLRLYRPYASRVPPTCPTLWLGHCDLYCLRNRLSDCEWSANRVICSALK